jgi:hypothetical protein
MSDKIKPHHLGRKAILYVRQSSAHQVTHNQESRILQICDARSDLGWREIEVIDDNLGRSAAGAVTRAGFERMVAEVCLGKVERWRPAKYRALPATVEIGSSSSRCAG